jgi:hypothetical protein
MLLASTLLFTILYPLEGGSNDINVDFQAQLPFCRKAQSQITSTFINITTGQKDIGVIIFGGEGINYYQPDHSILSDLW